MATTSESVTVVGICGSLRPKSYTRMALEHALAAAFEAGAETRLLDLREYQLEFCAGSVNEVDYPPDVARLCADVDVADGIILATPEYHSGYSGVLKNALDLMGFAQFEGKMVGLIGVAAGQMGALNALNGLRTVGRSLRAWVLPHQASVSQAHRAFADDGSFTDPRVADRVAEVGRMLTRFAFLHTSHHAREFLAEWERAQQNPGG